MLGVNFYEVFKPSTLFKEKLEKALSLAKKGDFSGFDDYIGDFKNGISGVELNDKCNLIDTNGNLLSQLWFDNVFAFNEHGIAQVELNRKWNLIDKNGKLLSKQWFDSYDDAYYFMREVVRIKKK